MSQLFIETLDDPIIQQFVQDFSGGEDSFRRSTLIDDNQCQHLVNVIVRDNYEARTRAGADAIPSAGTPPLVGATAIRSLNYFQTASVQQLLAAVAVGATPKFAKYEGGVWTDLSGSWTPATAVDRVEFSQGIELALLSDGVGAPQIYDGTNFTATGAGPADAPIHTISCWHTVRMFVAGIPSLPLDTIAVSNLLDFSDGNWDLVNRSFQVGAGDGDNIVALASTQTTVLVVLKQNSIWLVDTNPALDDPATPTKITGFTAAAVPGNLSFGIGCVGRDAWCAYANDILFMSQDGVRSVQRMQAATGQYQLSAPISQPIQNYILRINQGAWQNIVAKSYREFAFFFVPLDNSTTNNYVLVYNTRLGHWMGVWTMWNALCVDVSRFLAQPRLVFGDTAGLVNMWKDQSAVEDDATYLDNTVGYPTTIWTKSWVFGDPVSSKSGYNLEVRFTAGNATVMFSWHGDLVPLSTWNGIFEPTGDILGTDPLPFLLQTDAPTLMAEGVRGLPQFVEAYLRVESNTGWFFLRSVGATAFSNALSN